VGNAGFILNSGNWRLVNDEAQDNSCNGFYFLSVTDTSGDGLLADGNGPTGGGSGCAGYVFSGSSKNKITGVFRGVTDAGWSDYAINWIGGNSNNDVSLVVDNPKIGNYLGTLSNNNFHSDTLDVSSAAHTMNNGAVQRGYSDNQSTQTYSLDASTGIANYKNNQVSAAGNSIYSCGGPNNFDFANTSLLGLFYGSGVYAYTEGSTGSCVTGVPIPLLYNPPVRFGAGDRLGDHDRAAHVRRLSHHRHDDDLDDHPACELHDGRLWLPLDADLRRARAHGNGRQHCDRLHPGARARAATAL
jgi:hypothetical protein